MADDETTADIIAEMRGADNKCQLATKDGTGCYHCPFGSAASNCVFDNYADRLEAAHRRERGNAAKLREALVKIHTIAKTFIDATKMRRVTDSARLDVSNIKDLADAALATLAAPPRNCDRFATVDEARKAHEEYRGDYIMRASNKFDFPMKFEAWLFAPATEKEGGAK